jgi:hypothetical protein
MSKAIYDFLIESSKTKEFRKKENLKKALKIVNSFNKDEDDFTR